MRRRTHVASTTIAAVFDLAWGLVHTSGVAPPSVAPCPPASAREVPSGTLLGDRHEDLSFNAWLQSLPAYNWTGALNESEFADVEWVDGVGFVQRGV